MLTVEQRSLLLVDVLRDRGALLRETSEGRIENAYTLKLMNLDDTPRQYTVSVSGLPGLEIVGEREFSAEPGSIQPLMITVSAPGRGCRPVFSRSISRLPPNMMRQPACRKEQLRAALNQALIRP